MDGVALQRYPKKGQVGFVRLTHSTRIPLFPVLWTVLTAVLKGLVRQMPVQLRTIPAGRGIKGVTHFWPKPLYEWCTCRCVPLESAEGGRRLR